MQHVSRVQALGVPIMQHETRQSFPRDKLGNFSNIGNLQNNVKLSLPQTQPHRVPLVSLEGNLGWLQHPTEAVPQRQTSSAHLPAASHLTCIPSYSPSGSITARHAPVSRPRSYSAAASGSATSRRVSGGALLSSHPMLAHKSPIRSATNTVLYVCYCTLHASRSIANVLHLAAEHTAEAEHQLLVFRHTAAGCSRSGDQVSKHLCIN